MHHAVVGNLLLVADTRLRENELAKLPTGYVVRVPVASDVEALGRLYFEATDARVDSVADAVADMRRGVDGDYGEYWPNASPLVEHDHEVVAAIQTVRRAPWADTPPCPWINEVFTAPDHRRRGLARALLTKCMIVVAGAGQKQIALRVNEDNTAARTLYEQLRFTHPTDN